jgi:hypothetical protein
MEKTELNAGGTDRSNGAVHEVPARFEGTLLPAGAASGYL